MGTGRVSPRAGMQMSHVCIVILIFKTPPCFFLRDTLSTGHLIQIVDDYQTKYEILFDYRAKLM